MGVEFPTTIRQFKNELREAVANYMQSEGCSCCRDVEAHKEHSKALADLLGVKAHKDQSDYYDFTPYRTKK